MIMQDEVYADYAAMVELLWQMIATDSRIDSRKHGAALYLQYATEELRDIAVAEYQRRCEAKNLASRQEGGSL